MNIELRPIQYDSNIDKEQYFALQKSVAIMQNVYKDNEKYGNLIWKGLVEDKNRICFVIENLPGHVYCGECAVKNISDSIPEIEIELLKERQGKGIGYQAIVIMLNKLAEKYKKERFYAKVEPDNYVSQLLFEKLGGIPAGITRDYKVSDERADHFIKTHENLLDEKINKVAEKFGVEAKLLLTHVLVYLVDVNDMNLFNDGTGLLRNSREHIECQRTITKEKFVDMMKEALEDLQKIKDACMEESALKEKVNEIEDKLLRRIDKIDL